MAMGVETYIVITNVGLTVVTCAEIANSWHQENVIVKIVRILAPRYHYRKYRRRRVCRATPREWGQVRQHIEFDPATLILQIVDDAKKDEGPHRKV